MQLPILGTQFLNPGRDPCGQKEKAGPVEQASPVLCMYWNDGKNVIGPDSGPKCNDVSRWIEWWVYSQEAHALSVELTSVSSLTNSKMENSRQPRRQ